MGTRYVTVYVEMDDFEDYELIEELEKRGYVVTEKESTEKFTVSVINEASRHYMNGNVREALYTLEHLDYDLRGISKYVKDKKD